MSVADPRNAPSDLFSQVFSLQRVEPEGELFRLPAHILLKFNKPLIAVGESEPIDREWLPLSIEPNLPGSWRLLDTQTLIFKPITRFRYATDYRVTIQPDLIALDGSELGESIVFNFQTPSPAISNIRRLESITPDPYTYIRVEFNQEMDPSTLADQLLLKHEDKTWSLQDADSNLVQAGSIKEPSSTKSYLFRSTQPLPPDITVSLILKPGTKGLEGSLPASNQPARTLKTEPGFRFRQRTKTINKSQSFFLTSTVPLREDSVAVQIEPKIGNLQANLVGHHIIIDGEKEADTTYTVTLPEGLLSKAGEPMTGPRRFVFQVIKDVPRYRALTKTIHLNKGQETELQFETVGYGQFQVQVYPFRQNNPPAFLLQGDLPKESAIAALGTPIRDLTLTIEDVGQLRTLSLGLKPFEPKPGISYFIFCRPLKPYAPENQFGDEHQYAYQNQLSTPWHWTQDPSIYWWQNTELTTLVLPDTNLVGVFLFKNNQMAADQQVSLWEPNGRGLFNTQKTDENGSAYFSTQLFKEPRLYLVVEEDGNQWTFPFLPPDTQKNIIDLDDHEVKTRTDRDVYRIGETVFIKGWIRKIRPRLGSAETTTFEYQVRDGLDHLVAEGSGKISSFGSFHGEFTIPEGTAHSKLLIEFSFFDAVQTLRASHLEWVDLASFRRPDFKTDLQPAQPYAVQGESIRAQLNARYFSGMPLRTAPATLTLHGTLPHRREPRTTEAWEKTIKEAGFPKVFPEDVQTNDQGKVNFNIEVARTHFYEPYYLKVQASVTDLNHQTQHDDLSLVVYPARIKLDLRPTNPSETLTISMAITARDLENRLVFGNPIKVNIFRKVKSETKDQYQPVGRVQLVSQGDQLHFTHKVQEPGTYLVEAAVTDSEGRIARTQRSYFIFKENRLKRQGFGLAGFEIATPDRTLKQGETAPLVIESSSCLGCKGVIQLKHKNGTKYEAFQLENGRAVIPVTMGAADYDGLDFEVCRLLPKDRFFYFCERGSFHIEQYVPLEARVTSDQSLYRPGQTAVIRIQAKPKAQGAEQEATLFLIDEALIPDLELSNAFEAPNFFRTMSWYYFQPNFHPLQPGKPLPLNLTRAYFASEGAVGGTSNGFQIPDSKQVRDLEDAASIFLPSIPLDANGEALVQLTLPQKTGSFRVIVITGDKEMDFKKGECRIQTDLPFSLHPSPPQFLREGDNFSLSVSLHNRTERERTFELSAICNQKQTTALPGYQVRIPAMSREEVLIPMSAQTPGELKVHLAARADKLEDQVRISIPVMDAKPMEHVAHYQVLEPGSNQQWITYPDQVIPERGGLIIELYGRPNLIFRDAIHSLENETFTSTHQLSAQIIGLFHGRALGHTKSRGETEVDPQTALRAKALLLLNRETEDPETGMVNFKNWDMGTAVGPWVQVQTLRAMLLLHRHDLFPMEEKEEPYLESLRIIEQWTNQYRLEERYLLQAYAAFVLAENGKPDPGLASRTFDSIPPTSAPLDGLALLCAAYPDQFREETSQRFYNVANETTGSVYFSDHRPFINYHFFQNATRTQALVLKALIKVKADPDFIAKGFRGLTTQYSKQPRFDMDSAAWFLQAGADLFPNDHQASSILVDSYLGPYQLPPLASKAGEGKPLVHNLPMSLLLDYGIDDPLILENREQTPVFSRIAMSWSDLNPDLRPQTHGFCIERALYDSQSGRPVETDVDGNLKIQRGSVIEVRLRVTTNATRHDVHIQDFLPAGCEPLTKNLKPESGESIGFTADHIDHRKNRLDLFIDSLAPGTYEFHYQVLAATPGTFFVPPATVQCLYEPETKGRVQGLQVVVVKPDKK